MNELLFLAIFFLATFLIGMLLEKARIPWIFAALLLGVGLSVYNPWPDMTNNAPIELLSQMGMYFLLFIIGFELEIKKLFKSSSLVIKTTTLVISLETIAGATFMYFMFDVPLTIALLLAASFATVGEAVLLPILDEFKMMKTKLGQIILSIGVLDDIIEVAAIAIVVVLLGKNIGHSSLTIWINSAILLGLFAMAFIAMKFKRYLVHFKYKEIPSFFLFVIFTMFLFVGVGLYVESAALGALLAGISLRNITPKKILDLIDSEVRTISYGLFAPIFFMTVGLGVDLTDLIQSPFKMVIIILIMASAKLIGSFITARKELGNKGSLILGLGLSVKLSTSIVVIKLLLDEQMISTELYSVLLGATIVFLVTIPVLMSLILARWKDKA